MITIWYFDEEKFYTGVSEYINKEDFDEQTMTTVPLNTEFLSVKPKFDGTAWVDGATDEEIKEWKDENKIEPQPTELEILRQDNLMLNEAVTEMTMLISMILEGGM